MQSGEFDTSQLAVFITGRCQISFLQRCFRLWDSRIWIYSYVPENCRPPEYNGPAIRNTRQFPVAWKLVCLSEILNEMTKSERAPLRAATGSQKQPCRLCHMQSAAASAQHQIWKEDKAGIKCFSRGGFWTMNEWKQVLRIPQGLNAHPPTSVPVIRLMPTFAHLTIKCYP